MGRSKDLICLSLFIFALKFAEICLINNRSNFQEERIIVRKIAATFREERIVVGNFRGESPSKANYHSKNRADQNNRCHENAGKFRRNIVSSKISSKSQEFHRNSFALLLHNTVDLGKNLGEISKFWRPKTRRDSR